MEKIFDANEKNKAILVSVITQNDDPHEKAVSLDELERLLDTAGGELFACVTQQRQAPDTKTYVGSGKIEEIKELCQNNGVDLVICDTELSPSQIRNLEDALSSDDMDVRVIDRSMLILDIFALHAVSGEGKLQVELAQLQYTIPRLSGHGAEMSRLGGGIGTRGPGESKLETDRRHLHRRIQALKEQIAELEKNRMMQRSKRDKSGIPKIAIVGYTNAGKSTLLNRLTNAGILAEDKLFATLDPTTRKFVLPSTREILLTDTVGFIRNLPHHLVSAFRSTLDEICYADAIMIIIDASDPEAEAQLEVTEKLIFDLGASGKPTLFVLNKCDKCTELSSKLMFRAKFGGTVAISALDGRGVEQLIDELEKLALAGKRYCVFHIPYSDQGVISQLYQVATVEDTVYENDHITVCAVADAKVAGQYKKYLASMN